MCFLSECQQSVNENIDISIWNEFRMIVYFRKKDNTNDHAEIDKTKAFTAATQTKHIISPISEISPFKMI